MTKTTFKKELKTGIAEEITKAQDTKEMTRKAIKILENLGGKVDDLKEEFLKAYNEEV